MKPVMLNISDLPARAPETWSIFSFFRFNGVRSMLPLVYCICTAFKPLDELLIFPPRFFVSRPTGEFYRIADAA